MWQRGVRGTKKLVVRQLMLGWGKILDYLGRCRNYRCPYKWNREVEEREPEEGEKAFTGFEDGRRSYEPRNAGSL